MKSKTFVFVLVLILIFLAALFFIRPKVLVIRKAAEEFKREVVKAFPFSEDNSLKEWEEKIFKGRVFYRIERNEGLSYVRATSDKSDSALYYRIKLDAKKKKTFVSWKWRVEKFPVKEGGEELLTKEKDDFAARVYVIFPAAFFTNSKVLEYIWAETLPVGTTGSSPYSKNIKLIVLRSGPGKEWASEVRDITEDYIKVFGRPPEYDIGAIAFMTNAEHTETSADAMYDQIDIGYKEEGGQKP